jgi:hypothetical protein
MMGASLCIVTIVYIYPMFVACPILVTVLVLFIN